MEKLDTKMLQVIDEFDMDFNLGNAVLLILKSYYQDNPAEMLTKAVSLITNKQNIIKRQQDEGVYQKRISQ